MTRLIISGGEENELMLPYVTKFSPFTHLFSVSAGEGGRISCAKCDVALRQNLEIIPPIHSVQVANNVIFDAVFTSENILCVGSADYAVRFIDLSTYQIINTFDTKHSASVKTLCLSTNEKVFSGGRDGLIFEWNRNEAGPCASISLKKQATVTSIVMPNDLMIISSSSAGEITCWDLRNTAKPLTNIPMPEEAKGVGITSMALSHSKQMIASISTNNYVTVHKLDGEWGTITRQTTSMESYYNKICFSPCDKYMLTGSSLGGLNIFPLNTKFEPIKLLGHSGPATYVDWDSSYDYILSSSDDRTIQIWVADYEPVIHDPENPDGLECFDDELVFTVPKPKHTIGTKTYTLHHFYQTQ